MTNGVKACTSVYGYRLADSEVDARNRALALRAQGKRRLDDALDTAVRYRDLVQAEALLDAGANPNTKDSNCVSVLGHAIMSHCVPMVKLLVSRGVDPNMRTGLVTPLILCVYEEEWNMLRSLLNGGANVNGTGTIRSTALHAAVKYGRKRSVVALLLKYGARILATDGERMTPLDHALRNGDNAMIALLRSASSQRSRKGMHSDEAERSSSSPSCKDA